VYSLHPTMSETLTNQRVDELNRQAARRRGRRSQWDTAAGAGTTSSRGIQSSRGNPLHRGRPGSVRKAAGWALVDIGLRLAVPRRRLVLHGSTVQGRRAARRKAAFRVAR
jgi:hypothetical protein